MIPKLRLNPSTVRYGFGLSLGCLAALVLGACQTDSPAPSNPSEVVAKVGLTDPWKAPDQATWRTSGEPRAATLSGSGISYTASISLAGPLQTGTSVWLALWTAGMRTAEIRYVQQDGKSELKQEELVPDPVAMALLAKIPLPEQRNPDSLASVYAKALVDGDSAFKGFPANCPVGIDTARLIEAALVYAVAKQQKLSVLAATWSLAIDTAGVHGRIRALVEAGRVDGSDTLGMFPPPPVRVAAPLAVSGAVEAGGDLVDVSGRFEWDADLGQITVDAQVAREGRRIETVALSGLSIGSGERFLMLTGKARLLAGSAAPVGICSLVVVVRSERGDSARSAAAFEVKAASAPPQAPVIELVSPSEGSSFPFDSARIEVVWKVKSARSPVDTVFVADSLATKLTDSTWRAWVRLTATGKSSLVAVRARNAQGLWGTGSANFTRAKDQAAPDLAWLASGEDTAVESDVTFFVARLRAADASGIASVTFGEQAPDSVLAGGVYAKRIELGAPGTSVTIFVAVTDSAGNRTEASRKVVRKASNSLEIYGLPDTLRVWEDSVLEHSVQVNCPTGATCTVTAKVSDTTLAQVSVVGSATAAAIRIETRSDRNGIVDLDVELSTGTRKASSTARLVVKPVNDAPSLSVKASAMASPVGEVRISDWLVSSLAGPSDESGQKLRYTVVADSAASLLGGAPAMDAGALVFSPKGISGTVRFSIVALDDGDSVAPSVNKSAPQTLRVKLDAPPTLRVREEGWRSVVQQGGVGRVRIEHAFPCRARDPDAPRGCRSAGRLRILFRDDPRFPGPDDSCRFASAGLVGFPGSRGSPGRRRRVAAQPVVRRAADPERGVPRNAPRPCRNQLPAQPRSSGFCPHRDRPVPASSVGSEARGLIKTIAAPSPNRGAGSSRPGRSGGRSDRRSRGRRGIPGRLARWAGFRRGCRSWGQCGCVPFRAPPNCRRRNGSSPSRIPPRSPCGRAA